MSVGKFVLVAQQKIPVDGVSGRCGEDLVGAPFFVLAVILMQEKNILTR